MGKKNGQTSIENGGGGNRNEEEIEMMGQPKVGDKQNRVEERERERERERIETKKQE